MKPAASVCCIMLLAVFSVSSGRAQIPRLLSYQGVLTDTAGTPRPDGSYTFTFRLFTTQSGGSAIWSETKSVPVERGLFSTLLGDVTPLGASVTFEQAYWLSIQISGQSQMSPRIRLTPVGYSLTSVKSDTAKYALAAPPQGVADSARTSGTSHTLHLPAQADVTNPEFGLLLENYSTGDGLRAYSRGTAWNYAAVFGANLASTGQGAGVYGYSAVGPAVRAVGVEGDGIDAETSNPGRSSVFAHSIDAFGATCRSGNNFGLQAGGSNASLYDYIGDIKLEGPYGEIFADGGTLDMYSNGNFIIDLDNDNNEPAAFFRILSGTDGIAYTVDEAGNTTAAGTKSARVHTATHGDRLLYTLESPEVWFEDIGSASLTGGAAVITFDPVFAQTVNTGIPYHVFLTPVSDQAVLLFVSRKNMEGFTVQGRNLDGTVSTCGFEYRIVARRLGYEDVRLAPVDPLEAVKGREQAQPADGDTAPATVSPAGERTKRGAIR